MNKLTCLASLSLTALLAGCIGAPDAGDARDEDVSSVAQAVSTATTGTWSGFPLARNGTLQTATCTLSNGSTLKLSLGYLGNEVAVYASASANLGGLTLAGSAFSPNSTAFSTGTTTKITGAGNYGWFNLALASTDQGQLTIGASDGWLYSVGYFNCPATMVYGSSSASASSAVISGTSAAGATLTGGYTFSDSAGYGESGSTTQWYRISTGDRSAISGATSKTYTTTSSDVGKSVMFCVTPDDGHGIGTQVCSSSTSISLGASASDVTFDGNAYVGGQLEGRYTFSDAGGNNESGSTYQWYTVASGVSTAISGATSLNYAPASSDINSDIELCVTPADAFGAGTAVCSGTITIPGILWYSGANATGTMADEKISNGTCVTMDSIGMANNTLSVDLDGLASNQTTLVMYKTSNCTGTSYTRVAGAGTVHAISLATVGIGTKTLSYKVSW